MSQGPAGREGMPHGEAPPNTSAAPLAWALVAWILPITVYGVLGYLVNRDVADQLTLPVAFLCAIPAGVGVGLGLFAKGRPIWCGLGILLGAAYLIAGLIGLILR